MVPLSWFATIKSAFPSPLKPLEIRRKQAKIAVKLGFVRVRKGAGLSGAVAFPFLFIDAV